MLDRYFDMVCNGWQPFLSADLEREQPIPRLEPCSHQKSVRKWLGSGGGFQSVHHQMWADVGMDNVVHNCCVDRHITAVQTVYHSGGSWLMVGWGTEVPNNVFACDKRGCLHCGHCSHQTEFHSLTHLILAMIELAENWKLILIVVWT